MANAKVAITAENKMSKGLLQSKKDMMKFQQSVQKIGSTLKTAFAVTSVTVGLKKLGDAFASAFKDFNEAERKYKQLRITLGDGSAYDSVTKNIQKLSKLTLSSKGDIESMVSELAGLGKSADEVNMIADAAVALSNVTGKDLNTSMTALLNTFSGTTTTLKKMGLDVSDLTKDELANGAAVQLVIDKYYDLSKAMAEDDSMQHIQNMKNNLGDMKQVVGDFVNFTIAPLLADLDVFTENLLTNLNNFVQNLKVVISNFPEIMSRLGKALGEAMSNLFSIDGIKNLVEGVYRNIILKLQLVGNAAANLVEGIQGVLSLAIEGAGNYAMYWITGVANKLGIDISEVINSIGRWLTDSQIGKIVDSLLTKIINGVKLIGALIRNIPQIVKIVVSNIGTILSSLLTNIPKAIGQMFVGLGHKVVWFVTKAKNDLMEGIEDVINGIGDKIQSTWLGKFLGIGEGMANFDIGVNRSSENRHATNASIAFSNMKGYFSNIGDDLKPMLDEIDKLLSPTFEKFVADNSTTLGETLATWSAKSSDEYFEAAKKNFKDIGSFLKDWGNTFLGDLSTDWDAVANSLKTTFGDVFGDSFEDFVDWFKPFIYERLPKPSGTSTGTNTGSGSGGGDDDEDTKVKTFLDNAAAAVGKWTSDKFGFSSDQGSAFGTSVLGNVTESLGTAGQLMSELATNMATMGPILGAIATALKYVFEGFAETLGPTLESFVEYGLEPLREIGRVIGDILLPIFDTLMPLVQESMTSLIGLFDTIGVVLKPLISFISSALSPVIAVLTVSLKVMEPVIKILGKALVTVTGTFEYIGQALRHWVATLLNWLASINLMGWKPFEGLHTSDPGAPGDFVKYINSKYSQVDAAYATTAAATTSGTSVSTAVSSAGYQGATHVTINIYQQAPVVGDNGMRAFASMIRDEFEALDYYGVGA